MASMALSESVVENGPHWPFGVSHVRWRTDTRVDTVHSPDAEGVRYTRHLLHGGRQRAQVYNSTLRKTLGSLFGYQKIPRDKNYQINKKTKFGAEDENCLTAWMERNLLFAYLANDKSKELESFLIDSLLPPLNVEGSKAATLQRVHELRCDK